MIAQLAQAIVADLSRHRDSLGAPGIRCRSARVWEDVAGIRRDRTAVDRCSSWSPVASLLHSAGSCNRTTFGRTVTASADEPGPRPSVGYQPQGRCRPSSGPSPGSCPAASLIMLSGIAGSPSGIEGLGPSTLNRALAAAVIGGLLSFPRTIARRSRARRRRCGDSGSTSPTEAGLIDFLLFLAVVVAVFLADPRQRENETATFSFAPRVRPVPDRLRARSGGCGTSASWITGVLALVAAAVVPADRHPALAPPALHADPALRHRRPSHSSS
ncbi:MAG: hypothetical protein V9F03_10535 [Microthrixaceae bacterium]